MKNVLIKLSSLVLLVMLAVAVSACPRASAPPSARTTPAPTPLAKAAPKTKTDLEKDNLKGPVKQAVEEYEYFSFTSGKKQLVHRKRSETTYNVDGSRATYVHYSLGEDHKVSWSYRYDDNARLVEVKFLATYLKPSSWSVIYEYDARGLLTRSFVREPDGKTAGRTVYLYDSQCNKVREDDYRWDGTLSSIQRFGYDQHRNVLTTTICDSVGTVEAKVKNTYDSDERKIADSSVMYDKGSVESTEERKYDENGNRVSQITYDSDGRREEVRFSYEFDSHGNWTKKTSLKLVTKNGKESWEPDGWEYRTITYYPE